MKITCVCQHCQHTTENPSLEINFSDGMFYYVCEKCRKMNKSEFRPKVQALPRIGRLR